MLVNKVKLVTNLANVPDNGIIFLVQHEDPSLQKHITKTIKEAKDYSELKLKIFDRKQSHLSHQVERANGAGVNAFAPVFDRIRVPPFSARAPLLCRYKGQTLDLGLVEAKARIYKELSNIALFKRTEVLHSLLEQLRRDGVVLDYIMSTGSQLSAEIVTARHESRISIGSLDSLSQKWQLIKPLCE